MTDTNECYAYFYVTGSFVPSLIIARLGIKPTQYKLEGDPNPRTNIGNKCSRWDLHSRLAKTAALELHVSDVLTQLDENRSGFVELSGEFGGVMEIVGYFYADYPGLSFDHEVVERLAQFSLSIDCDFYYLYDDVDETTHVGTS